MSFLLDRIEAQRNASLREVSTTPPPASSDALLPPAPSPDPIPAPAVRPVNRRRFPTPAPVSDAPTTTGLTRDALSGLRERVIERVALDIDPNFDILNVKEMHRKIEDIFTRFFEQERSSISKDEQEQMLDDVTHEVLGLGPLERFLSDDSVDEIMVNGPSQVYIERSGKLELTDVIFENDERVMRLIDRIISPLGRRLDESSPMVDARLLDGSRINAIIPPLSLIGPILTIRKFASSPFTVERLIEMGTATPDMFNFLRACVEARLNIFISGGSSSGKTTTLNVLSSFIPNDQRIVTIEDAAELQLRQEHVLTLEARPPNIEGKGAIPIRELVRNALRMRPDRIIVGECRGAETLDMLQAMNTGHDGSMSTGHSNSPRDMLSRLETMVLMAGTDLPLRAVREQISSALDLIIHQSRLRDGSRKIVSVTEVQGMEGNVIVLQDVFTFEQTGIIEGKIAGRLQPSGIRPKFVEKLEMQGIRIPSDIFDPTVDHSSDPTYVSDLSFLTPSPSPARRGPGRFPYRGEGPKKWPED